MKASVGMIVVAAGLLLSACRGNEPPSLADGHPVRDPEALAGRIDSIAAAAIRDGPVAGLSIAVFRGSEPLLVKGYGFSDLEIERPATPATKYDIASVSKLFTALAVMKLVDEGKLSLDEDLTTLLPAFPNPEQGRRISLRQLLNHTSGLGDYEAADFVRVLRAKEPLPALHPSFVLNHLRGRPLDSEPGTEWRYTNSAFYLAGLIIENATGRRWGDYVRESIAQPLGLHDTWSCDALDPDQHTRGYERTDAGLDGRTGYAERLYSEAGVQGDGGLCSTARDLARLPAALAEQRLIPEALLAEMLQPTILADGVAVDYGLGVRRGQLGDHPVWGHTGSFVLTYGSVLAHYPDDGTTIAVLVNTTKTPIDALVIEGLVAQEIFGLTDSMSRKAGPVPAPAMYAGEYIGDRYYDAQSMNEGHVPTDRERFLIVNSRGRLERIVLTGEERPALELINKGNHSFGRADWPLDRFVFHVEDGRARGYSEYYNGLFATFNRRAQP